MELQRTVGGNNECFRDRRHPRTEFLETGQLDARRAPAASRLRGDLPGHVQNRAPTVGAAHRQGSGLPLKFGDPIDQLQDFVVQAAGRQIGRPAVDDQAGGAGGHGQLAVVDRDRVKADP